MRQRYMRSKPYLSVMYIPPGGWYETISKRVQTLEQAQAEITLLKITGAKVLDATLYTWNLRNYTVKEYEQLSECYPLRHHAPIATSLLGANHND